MSIFSVALIAADKADWSAPMRASIEAGVYHDQGQIYAEFLDDLSAIIPEREVDPERAQRISTSLEHLAVALRITDSTSPELLRRKLTGALTRSRHYLSRPTLWRSSREVSDYVERLSAASIACANRLCAAYTTGPTLCIDADIATEILTSDTWLAIDPEQQAQIFVQMYKSIIVEQCMQLPKRAEQQAKCIGDNIFLEHAFVAEADITEERITRIANRYLQESAAAGGHLFTSMRSLRGMAERCVRDLVLEAVTPIDAERSRFLVMALRNKAKAVHEWLPADVGVQNLLIGEPTEDMRAIWEDSSSTSVPQRTQEEAVPFDTGKMRMALSHWRNSFFTWAGVSTVYDQNLFYELSEPFAEWILTEGAVGRQGDAVATPDGAKRITALLLQLYRLEYEYYDKFSHLQATSDEEYETQLALRIAADPVLTQLIGELTRVFAEESQTPAHDEQRRAQALSQRYHLFLLFTDTPLALGGKSSDAEWKKKHARWEARTYKKWTTHKITFLRGNDLRKAVANNEAFDDLDRALVEFIVHAQRDCPLFELPEPLLERPANELYEEFKAYLKHERNEKALALFQLAGEKMVAHISAEDQ